MLTTVLMFIAALALSAVAGYYSVIGMTSIFAGAFIPIIIMAGILETSKVIVASWLYNNWKNTPLALKSYLTAAVVILMLITSMGIFGYLSKAHVEQAAAGQEQQAQLAKIAKQIDAQNAVIAQANGKLANIGKQGSAQNEAINTRIADANKIIDSANQQIAPQISEQQKIIDAANAKVEQRTKGIQAQIDDIDKQVSNLDAIIKSLIDQKRTGTATQRQQEQSAQRKELAKQKSDLTKQIDALRNAPDAAADAARREIARLRAKVDADVKQARDLIANLTAKLEAGTDINRMQSEIDGENEKIKAASEEAERLSQERFKLEAETRKLEVEVGPLKYIAQLIYGDNPDANLLERAVRYVIMTIIFVFDPLAVLMLIASNQGLAADRRRRAEAAQSQQILRSPISNIDQEIPAADLSPAVKQDTAAAHTAAAHTDANALALAAAIATLADAINRWQAASIQSPAPAASRHNSNDISQVIDQTVDEPSEVTYDPLVREPVTADDITETIDQPIAGGYIGLSRPGLVDDITEQDPAVDSAEPVLAKIDRPDVLSADDLFEHMKQRHAQRLNKHMANNGEA